MRKDIFEKLNELDVQNDQELIDAINNAKSLEEMVAIINAKGVNVTAEDLTGELASGELTEDALEEVAGGGKFDWGGFKSGYNDGYGNKNKSNNSFWYCVGYGVGQFMR